MAKVTHNDFVERIKERFNGEFSVESEYQGVRNEVIIKHTVCGYEKSYYPNNFKGRCLNCEGGIRYTPEEFKKKIHELVEDEYTVLDQFKTSSTKIRFLHNVCGKSHSFRPADFTSGGSRCPDCRNEERKEKLRKKPEEFKKEFDEISKGRYELLSTYSNSETRVKVRHVDCGNEYWVFPGNFLRGGNCEPCVRSQAIKTTEQFKQEVFYKWQDEYKVRGEYVRSDIKIKMFHKSCGKEFEVRPANFLYGTKCTHCYRKVKKTQQQFIEEVKAIWGEEFSILSDYESTAIPIMVRHNICGEEYFKIPNHLLRGHGCGSCVGNIKKDTEKYREDVFALVGDEYTVVGEYITSKDYIFMHHNLCKTTYPVKPNHFLNNRRCPECYGVHIRSEEEFLKQLYDLVGDEYSSLGEYKGYGEKITMKHNVCGFTWDKRIVEFITGGQRCPQCYGNIKKTTEEFRELVRQKVGDEYTVLEEYINIDEKIDMRHNKCGFEYPVTPYSFLHNGTRCPRCNESKGEKRITNFLLKENIEFKPQYRIKECRHINPLPFDFAIFDHGELICLIEYDGELHFVPRRDDDAAHTKLKQTQFRDSIKTAFCEENDIPLIRILYTEFDKIEAILNKELPLMIKGNL